MVAKEPQDLQEMVWICVSSTQTPDVLLATALLEV